MEQSVEIFEKSLEFFCFNGAAPLPARNNYQRKREKKQKNLQLHCFLKLSKERQVRFL